MMTGIRALRQRPWVILAVQVLLGAAGAGSAWAGPPSVANSTVPAQILLVGHDGLSADPAGHFDVVVRDLANQPCVGAVVSIDFSGAPDLAISTLQFQSGMSLASCTPAIVTATTDGLGRASFNIVGAVGTHSMVSTPSGPCTATITATPSGGGGVLLSTTPVAAFDLNGIDGVNADDVHLWLADFASGNSPCYSDFDNSGGVGASDLSRIVAIISGRRSTEPGNLCFGGSGTPALVQTLNLTLTQETVDCSNPPTSQFSTSTCIANKRTDWLCGVTLPASTSFDDITGVEATIDILGTPNQTLPGFYQFGTGGCHSGALSGISAQDLVGDAPNCLASTGAIDIRGGSSAALAVGYWPQLGTGATDRATIVALNVVQSAYVGPGDGGTCVFKYGSVAGGGTVPVLGFRIANNGAVCATSTCAVPVAFVLRELKLTAMSSSDPGQALPSEPCPIAPARAELAPPPAPRTLIIRPAAGSANVVYVNGVPPGLVLDTPPATPRAWLAAPSPNPAIAHTTIRFQLPSENRVRLAIYDVAGRRVRLLLDDLRPAGQHSVQWDGLADGGEPVRSGTYFLRLAGPGLALGRAIVLAR